MGCGGTKILAGIAETGNDERKSKYMQAAPVGSAGGAGEEEEAAKAGAAASGGSGEGATKSSGDFYTNLEDINDKEALQDNEPPGPDDFAEEAKDTVLDPESAEAKLRGYKERLKDEGKGTKRKKSTNTALVMATDSSATIIQPKPLPKGAPPPKRRSSKEKDSGADRSLLMGKEGERRQIADELAAAEKNGGSVDGGSLAAGAGQEREEGEGFEGDDFDF